MSEPGTGNIVHEENGYKIDRTGPGSYAVYRDGKLVGREGDLNKAKLYIKNSAAAFQNGVRRATEEIRNRVENAEKVAYISGDKIVTAAGKILKQFTKDEDPVKIAKGLGYALKGQL